MCQIRWRPIIWGLGLQLSLGVLILRWPTGYKAFKWLGEKVQTFLEFTDDGSKFVFGEPKEDSLGYLAHPVAFKVSGGNGTGGVNVRNKQRVLMHGHQGWNVRHGLCHIYMRYVYIYMYIYELFIAFVCFVVLLFVHCCNVMVCVVYWVGKWQSRGSTGMFGNLKPIYYIMLQFIQNHHLDLLCSWFENNPYFHKYSTDFHV